ncbi:arylsulfatase [Pontibacter saemangeumensis]|uniref:Arylsulfatase n=1 Tax=Pontibacter saemangeumensis TaxID=1084525 RepID=A0ABP8LGD6_9BACT
MKRTGIFLCIILSLFSVTACQTRVGQSTTDRKAPNIIFILTDDLGYGDLGTLFQNERRKAGLPALQTPFLDQLAAGGTLLTRHYAPAPVCAPSRASFLLGQHQGHANVRNNQFDKALEDNHTIASVLKEAGYATALVGKYGLQGLEGNNPETWEAYPTRRGFDHFFGYVRHEDGHNHYPAHEARQRPPVQLYHQNEEISGQLRGCYTTDLFTAAAKKWIIGQQQQHAEQPFFLYLAYDTPHAGLQVASAPYPAGGGLKGGVQWKGEAGNFINTVSDTIDSYIHPDYAGQDWPEQQKRHASMVRRIDEAVADVVQLLQDLDLEQETLLVFTSDNGPHHESYGYGDYNPTFFDSYGPLDGTKRDTWEGGIRVPTIVRWPGKIKAGQRNETPSGFHDWLATFAELGGVPAPANSDGVSLVPLLTGRGKQEQSTVYIEYSVGGKTPDYEQFDASHKGQVRGEMQVIYLDGYKGIRYNTQAAGDDFRIYETRQDPGEVQDLADTGTPFEKLQQRMKDRVLQVRRPDESAPRPYDMAPVPALAAVSGISPGLRYRAFEAAPAWVPVVATLRQNTAGSGVCTGIDLGIRSRENDIVIEYSGLLEVPETGEYTFSLQTDRGAVLRLHEATVIDADKGYPAGSVRVAGVRLAKGYHPVRLTYMHGAQGAPSLDLQWRGPGVPQRPVEAERLFHQIDQGRAAL